MRTMVICLLAVSAVAAAGLLAAGCAKSDEADMAQAPLTPPVRPADPGTPPTDEPEGEAGMAAPAGEPGPGAGGDAEEATDAAPTSVEEAMDSVIGPSSQALRAALDANDLQGATAEAVRIRDAATIAPTLEGAPTEQGALDEFTGYSDDMAADATAFIDAAEAGDAERAAVAAGALNEGCKACHDVFRTR